MSYNLNCIYDSRQSFYGKAIVTEYEDENKLVKELYSYSTRQQKEFFKQNGLSDKEIKELFKNEILEK